MNGGNYCRPEWIGLNAFILIYLRRPYYHVRNLAMKRRELVHATRLEF